MAKYIPNTAPIHPLFQLITVEFLEEYKKQIGEVAVLTVAAQYKINQQLNKWLKEKIEPVFKDLFKAGISQTNQIVPAEISVLTDQLSVPFKYNKEMLLKYNEGLSVFQGYYDKDFEKLFTRREVDKMKRIILTGKYSNWTDRELQNAILNEFKVTKNRALNIARNETTRLNTASKQIYYEKPAVKKNYNLVFTSEQDDKVRKTHKSYDKVIADPLTGKFDGDCGEILGPPVACSPWNCRCTIDFIKKPTE